ncbi:AAA family ATPase [Cystobacter fuscus]|uniref:AAA family ATPase n=1 Tax=Cystobacter fuscus TaxID=43 RepID=UPI0018E008CA|nr:adenylate/guanylate cyclase domain-containing protein [Cystobacter fuscus]
MLVPCVPMLVVHRAARHPAAPEQAESRCFPAAVLFADVSGFTPLTERLAQRGSAGAEELSRLLEQLFGPLVEVVTAHGGEILHFPGDALLASWPGREGEGALAEAVLRAAECGLALQRAMREPLMRELSLALRVAVGAGLVQAVVVGGVSGRWQVLVRGEPFVQLREAGSAAVPGEVVVSAAAWRCAGADLVGEATSLGGARVKSVRAPAPRALCPPELPEGADAALWPFVSRVLRATLEVGAGWLAELRRATVLFLRLDGLAEEASNALLPWLSDAVRAMQEAVYGLGGSVNQLLVDDKGLVLVAAFGLPTCAHEDDAARAVKAALQAHTALRRQGATAAIGIATGRVCCGLRGGATRYEYALMGRTVNLAARLMQEARDGILFDEATAQAVGERLLVERLPPVRVKGVAEPVPLFRPGGLAQPRAPRADPHALVGRAAERALLDEALEGFARGQGGVHVLEGEAGVGKSSLLTHVARGARARGLRVLSGVADEAENATVYYAWRAVFTAWLGLPPATSAEDRRAALWARLAGDPEAEALAPLLNPVLRLDLPDTERTTHLRDQTRADAKLSLMVRLLRETGPAVLLLEDGQWLDSSSWELLRRVARDLPGWLLVLSTRPLADNPPPALEFLLRLPSTRRVVLSAMADEDILALVCARLGVTRLQEEVAAFILAKAEGHPFYSEELAYTLRDNGLLLMEHGECRLAPAAQELDTLGLPSTLEGLITSRIDRLTTVQQLTLKAASVIGRTFGSRLLGDVHPLPDERERLTAHLSRLRAQDLALPVGNTSESLYLFKHAITQEVAYNLMLFSQRRRIHEAVARWYERMHTEELPLLYPRLAHHWLRANVRSKALEALEKAGEHALATYAPSEAVGFFSKALELEAEGPEREAPSRRARWERRLGRALRWLGRPEAGRHLCRALELLGHPVPEERGVLAMGTLLGAARQLLGRAGLVRSPRDDADREKWVEAAEACSDLGLLTYYELDMPRLGYFVFQLANFADRSGVASLRARAYASLTVLMGAVPAHGAARAYSRASLELASEAKDPHGQGLSRLSLSLYLMEAGRFAEAEETVKESIAGFTRLGNLRQADEAGLVLLNLHIVQGRLSEAAALAAALVASARRREDAQLAAWAGEDQGRVLWREGRVAEAAKQWETVERELDARAVTSLPGSLALAWLRQGHPERARALAETWAERMFRIPLTIPVLDGHSAMAETFLDLWLAARERNEREAPALERLARRFCEALERGVRACTAARPAACLVRGRLLLAEGRRRAARRRFEEAARSARELGMPWEAATAHRLLAGLDEADREWHLAESQRLTPG